MELTSDERAALEEFRDLRISIEDFGGRIKRRVSFDFRPSGPYTRSLQKHTDAAAPPVPVRREHLSSAFAKWRSGGATKVELSDWASMLLMNDDYEIVEAECDLIAKWLNEVALGTITSPDPC